MTEAAVLMFYLSGCAFAICGVVVGCTLWQRTHAQAKHEPCQCQWCKGDIKERRSLGKGGFGEAALARRHGRTIVLKKIGCGSVNDANQALLEAACLQRLHHPGVVTFEDVFLHRHNNGGCSVMIAMEYCAGGDLIDRMACKRNELPLTEAQLLSFFATLCRTLFYVRAVPPSASFSARLLLPHVGAKRRQLAHSSACASRSSVWPVAGALVRRAAS
eukprot:scaffold57141_cov33-Tisochrysis_lutea.AAC.1